MPSYCCVVGCSSNAARDRYSFFRIPKVLTKKYVNELSQLRRDKWLQAINRADFDEVKQKYARVCSKHFVSGRPAELTDIDDIDWVPCVNMGEMSEGLKRKRNKSRTEANFQDLPETSTHEVKKDIIGNRITSVQYFFDTLQSFAKHRGKRGCSFSTLQITSEETDGLNSEITVHCTNCMKNFMTSLTDPSSQKSSDLNISVLSGEVGPSLGYLGLKTLLETVDLPTMSMDKYNTVLEVISVKKDNEIFIKEEIDIDESIVKDEIDYLS